MPLAPALPPLPPAPATTTLRLASGWLASAEVPPKVTLVADSVVLSPLNRPPPRAEPPPPPRPPAPLLPLPPAPPVPPVATLPASVALSSDSVPTVEPLLALNRPAPVAGPAKPPSPPEPPLPPAAPLPPVIWFPFREAPWVVLPNVAVIAPEDRSRIRAPPPAAWPPSPPR